MIWSTSTGGEIALKTLAGTGTLGERTSDIVENTRQFFGTDLVRRIALHRRLSCDGVELSKLGDQETKLLVGLVGWVLISHLRLEQRRLDLSASALADLLRCSCGGKLEDARGRSAPVGTLLFVHHRDASASPTRITRPRSREGDPCVIHALPWTIGFPSCVTTGTMLKPLPRRFRRRRTIRAG